MLLGRGQSLLLYPNPRPTETQYRRTVATHTNIWDADNRAVQKANQLSTFVDAPETWEAKGYGGYTCSSGKDPGLES